jgi:hypothetical protein
MDLTEVVAVPLTPPMSPTEMLQRSVVQLTLESLVESSAELPLAWVMRNRRWWVVLRGGSQKRESMTTSLGWYL